MPRKQQYATRAEQQKAYRDRKAGKVPQAPLPAPIEVSAEDTETVEQASRAGGVPRDFKLSAWKRAAKAFLAGEEGSVQAKVKALRSLCSTDKEMRKKVVAWLQADSTEATKKLVAARGWTLTDGAVPVDASEIDRLVRELEAGRPLSAADREIPGDSEWAKTRADLIAMLPSTPTPPPSRLCDTPGCPEEWRLDFWGDKRCYAHSKSTPGNAQPGPDYNPSPAAYINSAFGAAPSPTVPSTPDSPRVATLKALGQALYDGNRSAPTGKADYGPTEGWPTGPEIL